MVPPAIHRVILSTRTASQRPEPIHDHSADQAHIFGAIYSLYADSGFAMAGAVAYSFVLSLFPFCIFVGAVAGYFGGEAFAKQGVAQLFEIAPAPVAEALAPEVMAVMGRSRFGLLTVGALIALFFATSAIESLRAALNNAYRQKESRSYFRCLLQSSLFVILSAIGVLVLTWGVVVGPELAARFKPASLLWLADSSWIAVIVRFAIVVAAIGSQLLAYHLWLAAGDRRLAEVWPGVLLSIVLWVLAARLFGSWLTFSDYSRFYAGLTQIMSALVFFQVSAIIVILGAELNRGLHGNARTPGRANQRRARLESADDRDDSRDQPNRLRLSSMASSNVRKPRGRRADEHRHVAGLVLVLPHARVRLGNLRPRKDLGHGGVDTPLDHQLVGLCSLQQVGEVRTLHALLMHPQIARVHGEVVAGRAGADDHHAAALHDEHGDRKRGRAGMLEHEIDVVALAGDLPDGGAELAHLLEPRVVLGRADLGHLAPAVELLAVDDAAGAELHDEVALVVLGDDADGVGARWWR